MLQVKLSGEDGRALKAATRAMAAAAIEENKHKKAREAAKTIIARELDVRLIDTICIVSYRDDHSQGELEVLKPVEHNSEGWLLIDDLVDTGKTARKVRELMPKAHFATVYAKPAGRPLVDSFVTEVSQDTWILFPWDTELQSVPPIIQAPRR